MSLYERAINLIEFCLIEFYVQWILQSYLDDFWFAKKYVQEKRLKTQLEIRNGVSLVFIRHSDLVQFAMPNLPNYRRSLRFNCTRAISFTQQIWIVIEFDLAWCGFDFDGKSFKTFRIKKWANSVMHSFFLNIKEIHQIVINLISKPIPTVPLT